MGIPKVKFTHSEIQDYFLLKGCKLVSTTYKRNDQLLDYVCSCGAPATTRWKLFYNEDRTRCRKCGVKKAEKTARENHGGLLYFQTPEFLVHRKQRMQEKYGVDNALQSEEIKQKRRRTNMDMYGVPEVSSYPAIKARQRNGFKEKYGVSHFMLNPSSKAKFLSTLKENHGVSSLAALSTCASKQSQKFFSELVEQLPLKLKISIYYASNQGEFVVTKDKKNYKYDFVVSSLKKAIEYNGSKFHPKNDQDPDEVGWCVFHPKLSVAEARGYEKAKYQALEDRGYEILTVWDTDYLASPKKLVSQTVDWLLTPRNL